jgi:hypothetical protein
MGAADDAPAPASPRLRVPQDADSLRVERSQRCNRPMTSRSSTSRWVSSEP